MHSSDYFCSFLPLTCPQLHDKNNQLISASRMHLELAQVIGIAVGGGIAVVALVALAVFGALRWKYGAPSRHCLEHSAGSGDSGRTIKSTQIPSASTVIRTGFLPFQSECNGPAFVEGLTHPAHRTRDSTVPLQISSFQGFEDKEKPSGSFTQQYQRQLDENVHLSHLSTVLESPSSSTTGSPSKKDRFSNDSRSGYSKKVPKSKNDRNIMEAYPVRAENRPNITQTSPEEPSGSLIGRARLPSFRKSVVTNGAIGILDDYKKHDLSFGPCADEDPFQSSLAPGPNPSPQQCKSIRLVNQEPSAAPTWPPPALSLGNVKGSYDRINCVQCNRTQQAIDQVTQTESDSQGHVARPSLSAKEGFSLRNQGMNLLPKLRQLEPDHIRNEVILGSRPESRCSSYENNTDNSLCAPLPGDIPNASCSLKQQRNDERISGRMSRCSIRSDHSKSPSSRKRNIITTPTKTGTRPGSQINILSATGSPVGREHGRNQGSAGTNTEHKEKLLEGCTPGSIDKSTHMKSNHRKPSSLKGSPTSRGKRNKGSGTVRIQISPKFYQNSYGGAIAHDSGNLDSRNENNVHALACSHDFDTETESTQPFHNITKIRQSNLGGRSADLAGQTSKSEEVTQDPRFAAVSGSGSPSFCPSQASASSSTLLLNFPETPGKTDAPKSGKNIEVRLSPPPKSMQRLYSGYGLVPQGLNLTKQRCKDQSKQLQHLSDDPVDSPPNHNSREIKSSSCKYISAAGETYKPARATPHVRLAPLSSTVNPLNTKPDLPPPYTSRPPIMKSPPVSSGADELQSSLGSSVLSQVRSLRQSRLLTDASSTNGTEQGSLYSEPGTPTHQEMQYMHMRQESPTLPGCEEGRTSPGPLFKLNRDVEAQWKS